jgi:hypothetical protein
MCPTRRALNRMPDGLGFTYWAGGISQQPVRVKNSIVLGALSILVFVYRFTFSF